MTSELGGVAILKNSKRLFTAFVVLMIAALGACGGDSTPTGSSNTPAGNTQTTPPVTGGVPNFSSTDCQAAALALAAATAGGFSGGGGALDQSAATLQRMASGAPSAIKAAIENLAAATSKFYNDLKAAGIDLTNPSTYTNAEAAAALQKAGDDFEASGAKAAADQISAYFDQICPGAR